MTRAVDFQEALGIADRRLADRGLPVDVDRRLRQRLNAPRRQGLRFAFPLGLSLAAAAGVVLALQARPGSQAPAPAPEALAVVQASADLALVRATAGGLPSVEVTSGRCTLVDAPSGSTFAVLGPTRLERAHDGVRVARGKVEVTVRHRAPGSVPARVLVSGGDIEIMGTRFTVVQGAERGEVTLHEGRIRFVSRAGVVTELVPGESHRWPPAAEPAPAPVEPAPGAAPAPVAPAPRRAAAATAEPIDQLTERVALLRSRGAYEDAARELARAVRNDYRPEARERLSYELGSILTRQIADRDRACAHWRAHAQRYGRGRYDREIEQATTALRCRRR